MRMVLVLVQAGESCATENQQDKAASSVVGGSGGGGCVEPEVVVVTVMFPDHCSKEGMVA